MGAGYVSATSEVVVVSADRALALPSTRPRRALRNKVLKTSQFKTICPTLACTIPAVHRPRRAYAHIDALFFHGYQRLSSLSSASSRSPGAAKEQEPQTKNVFVLIQHSTKHLPSAKRFSSCRGGLHLEEPSKGGIRDPSRFDCECGHSATLFLSLPLVPLPPRVLVLPSRREANAHTSATAGERTEPCAGAGEPGRAC